MGHIPNHRSRILRGIYQCDSGNSSDTVISGKAFHECFSGTYVYKTLFLERFYLFFRAFYTGFSGVVSNFIGSIHSAGMAEKGKRIQPPDPEHLRKNRIIKIKEKDLSLSVAGLVKV